MMFCYVFIWELTDIGSVDSCCTTYHENVDDKTAERYNLQVPSGRESYLETKHYPKNQSFLFPLFVNTVNVTCDELQIDVLSYVWKGTDSGVIYEKEGTFDCA